MKWGIFMKETPIRWPNQAKCAVLFTIHVDGDSIYNGDREPAYRAETYGNYGPLRAVDRLLDLTSRKGIPCTYFIPGQIMKRYPEMTKQIASSGHEIAAHGYAHEDFGLLTPDQQIKAIDAADRAIEAVTGCLPRGFRLPEGGCTKETPQILIDHGYLYDSSFHDHDLPYFLNSNDGNGSIVEIPFHWELQDFPYFAFGPHFTPGESRIAIYDDVLENWLCELEAACDLGCCYVVKFDPQTIGSPGRIFMFDKILETMKERGMWITTCGEMASYIRQCWEELSGTGDIL